MDKRRKRIDPEVERELRDRFEEAIAANTLSIPEAVKSMRRLSKLTQAEFAAHRGIDVSTLKSIEYGQGNPKLETLNKIADIFGLELRFVKKRR